MPPPETYTQPPDFLKKSSLWLAVISLLALPPFAIHNFLQGLPFLGIGALVIVAICGFNAWSIMHLDRYYPLVTLLALVPAILFFLLCSIHVQGVIGVLWSYPAVLSFYFVLPERKAWLANIIFLLLVLPYAWHELEIPLATRMVATLLTVSLFSAIFIRVITRQQNRLQAQAVTDPLTGVFNRMLLSVILEQAILQNNRTDVPMTLVTLDVDHFKSINDAYGHDKGDTVLQGLGTLLQGRCRRVDKVFRLGGEEFLVLLYATDNQQGQQFAEELRQAIASLPLLPDNPVTVSLGVATLQHGEAWKAWLKRSDEHLYRAKQNGRNQIAA